MNRPPREFAAAPSISPTTPIPRIGSTSWTPRGERYDVYDSWVRSDVVPLEVNVDTGGR
ncbi:hypothetical protein AB0M34_09110 [Nocardia sp. NPDC050193]